MASKKVQSQARVAGLRIRKLADTSVGERVVRYDPDTGEKYLANPATGQREPWPLKGVQIVGEPGALVVFSTGLVARGRREGWIRLEGEQPAHRPGGPDDDRWRVSHTFLHADVIVILAVDGEVRYRVVHQPDKYAEDDDATEVTDDVYKSGKTRVDHFYLGELED